MTKFSIVLLDGVTDRDLRDINLLRAEISSSGPTTLAQLAATLTTGKIFVARQKNEIVGMAVLAIAALPGGWIGYVENVGVRESLRGQGAGAALMQAIIDYGRDQGFKNIRLTTEPARLAANRLYRRLGFTQRETNFYQINF